MTTAWPKGVIARYLTLGGASVDVSDRRDSDIPYIWRCLGCGHWDGPSSSTYYIEQQAQTHAEACRAMPQPGVTK